MGKPSTRNGVLLLTESIGMKRYTRGTETSKYPEEEKTIVIPSVAASERGVAQTVRLRLYGVAGRAERNAERSRRRVWKGSPKRVKVSYPKLQSLQHDTPSTAGHEKSRGNQGGPPPKAKYYLATDSEPVP